MDMTLPKSHDVQTNWLACSCGSAQKRTLQFAKASRKAGVEGFLSEAHRWAWYWVGREREREESARIECQNCPKTVPIENMKYQALTVANIVRILD